MGDPRSVKMNFRLLVYGRIQGMLEVLLELKSAETPLRILRSCQGEFLAYDFLCMCFGGQCRGQTKVLPHRLIL